MSADTSSTSTEIEDNDGGELDLPEGFTLDGPPELPTEVPEGYVLLVLRVDNTYELYDDEVTTYGVARVTPPPSDDDSLLDWESENIHPYMGVGRPDGDSWHDAEVLASSAPDVIPVGTTYDFGY